MQDEIICRLSEASNQARLLALALANALLAARQNQIEPMNRALTETPLLLGVLATQLGWIHPHTCREPFQFSIATGQYNPEADSNGIKEYPDDPPVHFTICIEHAIRVIGGRVQGAGNRDDLPDVLFERQTTGRWLISVSHQNADPACVVEVDDDRTARIYDVNYWAGNVLDRRSTSPFIVAGGSFATGWYFIGPFRDEPAAADFARRKVNGAQMIPLGRPEK